MVKQKLTLSIDKKIIIQAKKQTNQHTIPKLP